MITGSAKVPQKSRDASKEATKGSVLHSPKGGESVQNPAFYSKTLDFDSTYNGRLVSSIALQR